MDCLICGAGACACKGVVERAADGPSVRIINIREGQTMANQENPEAFVAEEGVFLNSEGAVVFGKDPDRKTQIVAPGGMVTPELVARYNIVQPQAEDKAPEKVEEDAPDEQPKQAKAVDGPANNKALRPAQSK
jgi:hypothetical protein